MCNQVLKSNIQTTPSENIIIIITLTKYTKSRFLLESSRPTALHPFYIQSAARFS